MTFCGVFFSRECGLFLDDIPDVHGGESPWRAA